MVIYGSMDSMEIPLDRTGFADVMGVRTTPACVWKPCQDAWHCWQWTTIIRVLLLAVSSLGLDGLYAYLDYEVVVTLIVLWSTRDQLVICLVACFCSLPNSLEAGLCHVDILVIPDLIDALLDKHRPRPLSMSYSPAHPRPMSGRRPSRVHFDDEGGPNLLADCMPLPSREEDPYNPRDGKTRSLTAILRASRLLSVTITIPALPPLVNDSDDLHQGKPETWI